MITHIIQVRDMIAELQRHDPCTKLVCYNNSGTMAIDKVGKRNASVAIHVFDSFEDEDLTKKFDELENENIKARTLLERFDSIQQVGGLPLEVDKEIAALHEDVDKFLTNRTTL